MATQTLSSLDARSLARRLGELASEERHVQVEFLLHLDEFDRRRAWLELGYGSLWTWCLEVLHLREGAAGRRINAMRVLRRFPGLAGALRDGRLCLSTLALLGQVLTEENAEELVARAAFQTMAEVDHLVASLKPRQAPREGIRRLPEPATAESAIAEPAGTAGEAASPVNAPPSLATPQALTLPVSASEFSVPGPLDANRPRAEMRAVSEGQWSLRATIGRACKDDLETLTMLLSHKVPRGDLAAVLHEAIRCGLEKHGRRKGAVKPARQVAPKAPSKDPAAIPAELRRQVWERDGGRCAFTGPDGKRCGSRWKLEVDHVLPPSRGGASTLGNTRLACAGHNLLYAEQVYGREFMQKYRKGESTIAGGSNGAGRARREAHAAG